MWAHQAPFLMEWGSPGPSVSAWWARWSALHERAEFWNVEAPKARKNQRTGAEAR